MFTPRFEVFIAVRGVVAPETPAVYEVVEDDDDDDDEEVEPVDDDEEDAYPAGA